MRPFAFRSRRRVPRQGGFSLVELMIAVVIAGVLASVAAVAMSTEPEIDDEAAKIAALVNEAARLAISGGPVDPGAMQTGFRTRGQVRVGDDGQGQYLLVERIDDQSGSFTEIETKRVFLGKRVRVVGWSQGPRLQSGTTPDAPFNPGPFFQPVIGFAPDGTTIARGNFVPTGATLYLQDVKRPSRKARVVILPLNGMMTQVFSGW